MLAEEGLESEVDFHTRLFRRSEDNTNSIYLATFQWVLQLARP